MKQIMQLCKRLLICLVMFTVAQADPLPFPCDRLWQIELNRLSIVGPSWLEDGEVHFLVWRSQMLTEISDGRIVENIRIEDANITAMIKADCHENEGEEFLLVSFRNHTRSTIKILEAGTYELLETITLNDLGKINTVKWIGGDTGLMLLFTETIEYGIPYYHSGSAVLYSLFEDEIVNSIPTGKPPFVSYWQEDEEEFDRILTGGHNNSAYGDGELRYTDSSTQISTMTIGLESFRQRVPTQAEARYRFGAPYPGTYTTAVQMVYSEERGNVAFIAIYDSLRCTLFGYTLPEISEFGTWDLEGRSVVAMEPFDNVDVDQPRRYLLCFNESNIRLFDLVEFRFNPQEYISPVGNRWIRIEDFDEDGNLEMLGYDGNDLTLVGMQALSTPENPSTVLLPKSHIISSYPNPFNSSTTITYSLPTRSNITLQIYNTRGQLVDVLLDRMMPAGRHSVVWDVEDMGTGMYLLKLKTTVGVASSKLLFIR